MIVPLPLPADDAPAREWALYLARRAAANNNARLADLWRLEAGRL